VGFWINFHFNKVEPLFGLEELTVTGRPKKTGHVQVSVLIPHDVYHRLHELRLARSECGTKLPALGELLREALEAFVGRQAGTSTQPMVVSTTGVR
jgi:hypothetical protein